MIRILGICTASIFMLLICSVTLSAQEDEKEDRNWRLFDFLRKKDEEDTEEKASPEEKKDKHILSEEKSDTLEGEPTDEVPEVIEPGSFTLHASDEIKQLNGYYKENPLPVKGFRVQIFFSSNRDEANDVRSDFIKEFEEDYEAYMSYFRPNFRVRVGDFVRRNEAEEALHKIRKNFPGAYIVPDEIVLEGFTKEEEE